jgi:RsiW-degrading membrane proteinase PrsW (M82 family)
MIAHRPSRREYIFFLISGIIVSVPLTLFTGTFTNQLCFILPLFYAQICSVAIFTPFIEEFAKAYPLFYRHGESDRSLFILGFLTGLGFGISEFMLYVFQLGAPIFIRLPGLFFHAASTSITAYGITKNKPLPFYIIAVALHFLNNLSSFFGAFWYIGGTSAIIASYSLSWRLFRRTLPIDRSLITQSNQEDG